MKISKFLWSVLVLFATVALIAPQQVEAIIIDGRVSGQTVFSGSGTITESSGINSNGINGSGINELDFNGQNFPHGPLSVTGATGDFSPILGSQANFDLAIRWTGSGSSVTLLDRKSTRLNSSHLVISYAVFCLKKKKYYVLPRA